MKAAFRSLSSQIGRVQGTQVETDGKLNYVIKNFYDNGPIAENREGEDADDPDAIPLPLDSQEQFHLFDAKLKDDKDYRMKIVSNVSLRSLNFIKGDYFPIIFRKYFSFQER